MTTIAETAKPVAMFKKLGIPAPDTAVESIGVKASPMQMPSSDIRRVNTLNDVSEAEDATSLNVLITIVFGILCGALVAAVLTITLSR